MGSEEGNLGLESHPSLLCLCPSSVSSAFSWACTQVLKWVSDLLSVKVRLWVSSLGSHIFGIMVNNKDSGFKCFQFKSWFSRFPCMTLTSHIISLCPSFILCKLGTTMYTSWAVLGFNEIMCTKEFSKGLAPLLYIQNCWQWLVPSAWALFPEEGGLFTEQVARDGAGGQEGLEGP